MALPVWTADANHFTVDDNVQHTADGWHDHTAIVVVTQLNAGGDDPRRRRYRLIAAQKEEKLIMMVVKEYIKITI